MKKKKLKIKSLIITVLALLLVIAGIYYITKPKAKKTTPAKKKTEVVYCTKVTNKTKKDVDEGITKTIKSYLDLYMKTLITLEPKDVSSLYSNPDGKEAYMQNAVLYTLTDHHKLQAYDMTLSSGKYTITYKSIKTKGDTVTVYFLENDTIKYKALEDNTRQIDVENTFKLKKTDDGYKIKSIRVVSGYDVIYTEYVNTSKDNAKDKVDSLKEKYHKNFTKMTEEYEKLREEANSKKYTTKKTYKHEYDRNAALEYANEYCDHRNPKYTAYDNMGGNCMNFTSQCIHAGGIPFDYYGKQQWKHYSSTLNTRNVAKGRSRSFVSTVYFYKYAKNNTGKGMVCDTDVNLFYGETGDVCQVGKNGKYSHSTIITGQLKDKDGNVIDLLLNSNTGSLQNAPMCAYLYNKRVIKVLGYN